MSGTSCMTLAGRSSDRGNVHQHSEPYFNTSSLMWLSEALNKYKQLLDYIFHSDLFVELDYLRSSFRVMHTNYT